MIDPSLAHPAHPVPAESGDFEHVGSIVPRSIDPRLLSPRFRRGVELAVARFEEIERVKPWIWSVPSCSGEGAYTVDLKAGTCSCLDRTPAGETDKHVVAARYKKARTATCSGCRGRFRHRELFEVGDDNLTFFEGDLLCEECAGAHGVL